MKHFLKAVAVVAVVIIVNMIINIICNMRGIDLNSTATGAVSAVSAMLLYQGLIRNENKKDNRE